MRIMHVVGARPNFVKMAPVIDALAGRDDVEQLTVHTGQHYDRVLSDEIFADLQLPEPDHFLGIGSGTHAEQTGRALTGLESLLMEEEPDMLCVGGDVNSTLAAALAAAKLGVPVAHIESGLRSADWTMPEEINRVLTDRLSDLLLTHSPEAEEHLAHEGIDPARVRYVGNTMIDSLRRFEHTARERVVWRQHGVDERGYVLVTLHRPSNVDEPAQLARIVDALAALGTHAPIVFPVHPRTRARLADGAALERLERAGVRCTEPVGYLDFLSLQAGAGIIVTDSGGVQEEASALGVPCYTLRANTERPVTITRGSNVLLGDDPASLLTIPIAWRQPTPCAIPLWDGRAADRAAEALLADYPAMAEIQRAA
jgi:UDP-N-acetylglucosamine 2-epimerase (non-hydrolysing)